ncbi:MAG: amidohydrolase family protein [Candidatus Glassbacteria bacterium]|nr:amidohydrolase family protein [Candidatus Glassbacteria bacterium]
MKAIRLVCHFSGLILPLIFLAGCGQQQTSVDAAIYNSLKSYIDSIKVIDTHQHQKLSSILRGGEVNFYTILSTTGLGTDLVSAGSPGLDADMIERGDLDSLWKTYGVFLDRCRNTSVYGHLVQSFRILYDMDEPYFTRDNIEKLSAQLAHNYNNPESWYREALEKAPIELMLNDQWWDQFKVRTDFESHALVMRIDMYMVSIAHRAELERADADTMSNPFYQARREDFEIRDLDDYLAFADRWFAKFVERGALCAKTANAYHRSIDYRNVSKEEAYRLFARPPETLTPGQRKRLEDYMFFWCVGKCAEYDLPLQIHTGYLAGNSRSLENGRPMKLLDVFQAFPQVKFSLFHGGFPWYQEIGALAKSYPNVYVDLCWLPVISRETAVSALHQWLDCVPYTKFFWGGDCYTVEDAVGSLEYGRDVVAQVLAERVSAGRMSMELAREVARGIFRNNAIRFFKLKEKFGKDFN